MERETGEFFLLKFVFGEKQDAIVVKRKVIPFPLAKTSACRAKEVVIILRQVYLTGSSRNEQRRGKDSHRELGVEIVRAITASRGDEGVKWVRGDVRVNQNICLFQCTEARKGVSLGIQKPFHEPHVKIKLARAYTPARKSAIWLGDLLKQSQRYLDGVSSEMLFLSMRLEGLNRSNNGQSLCFATE